MVVLCFFFKQKTAYEMRISDWSSDVCSSDLAVLGAAAVAIGAEIGAVAQELVDQIAVRGVELDTVEPGGKRVSRRPRVIVEQAGDFGDVERARLGISLLARIGMAFALRGRRR